MAIYVVTYDHPNEIGWKEHVLSHVAWLQSRVCDGCLLASGPFVNESQKSALLVMTAPNLSQLREVIDSDPFAIEGLIENLSIREWDPIFGVFNPYSSMPGRGETT